MTLTLYFDRSLYKVLSAMDEKRTQAYLDLINQLLSCPPGEEAEVLDANTELIDDGLLSIMTQVAEGFAQEGDENSADFLNTIVSHLAGLLELPSVTTVNSQIDLLIQLLLTTEESEGDPEAVYPLLEKNVKFLDKDFIQVLQDWSSKTVSEVEPEEAEDIGILISALSSLLQDWTLGKRNSNLGIAIAGYEVGIKLLNPETFPEEWAATQYNLANAYAEIATKDTAENIEKAITCYQKALQVYNRETFPQEWAMTQNNLGNALCERVEGERLENIDAAIKCYQAALQVHSIEEFPQAWEMTQNNLNSAYEERNK